eukprot:GEMP01091642.1.p1 GENE.GEMP01091642.1~~GEMP01091642.1.p1  ORF type:complete len:156 (+),score=11.19 GEMP01091642.1:17-484(+)
MSQIKKKLDPHAVQQFWAKASIATRLLHSRLALPLVYPLTHSTGNDEYPSKDNPIAVNRFRKDDVVRTMGYLTPTVVGMSKMANLLKAAHALEHYRGTTERNMYAKDDSPETRLIFMRPQVYRKHPKVTQTGIGHGWEDVASGTPADSVTRRFTT